MPLKAAFSRARFTMFGTINMSNMSACSGSSQRATSRVRKQVKNFHRVLLATLDTLNLLHNPMPVFCLLSKHAKMANQGLIEAPIENDSDT